MPEVQLRAAAVVPVAPAARPARARWSPTGLAWALWVLATAGRGMHWVQDRQLRQAGRPDLAPLGAGVVAPVLAPVSAATVGAVLASRRPRHPVGWLLAVSLCLSGSGVVQAYADYGLQASPGSLPAAATPACSCPRPWSPP